MKKQLLFLLITSILPLAASLPSDIDPIDVKTVQAIYGEGQTVDQRIKHVLETTESTALTNLGISEENRGLIRKVDEMMPNLNNISSNTPGPKLFFDENVPPYIRRATERVVKKQGNHLPIAIKMLHNLPANHMGTYFNTDRSIRTAKDLKEIEADLIHMIHTGQPVATIAMAIDQDPKSLDVNGLHEAHHVLTGDTFRDDIVDNDLLLKTKIEQDPSYQALSFEEKQKALESLQKKFEQDPNYQVRKRIRETGADIHVVKYNPALIKPAQNFFHTMHLKHPEVNAPTHPTYFQRYTQMTFLERMKRVEKYHTYMLTGTPFENEPVTKKQKI